MNFELYSSSIPLQTRFQKTYDILNPNTDHASIPAIEIERFDLSIHSFN